MTTAVRKTLNNLDLIRISAAAQVALLHSLEHLNHLPMLRQILGLFPGVPIFFFVSGFLITKSWVNTQNLKTYAINRFLRIYPALIICFFVCIVGLLVLDVLHPNQFLSSKLWLWMVAQLSVLQFYNPDFLRGFGVGVVNGSLWTVSVELQFYVLAPLFCLFLKKNKLAWMLCLFAFVILNFAYHYVENDSVILKLIGVSFLPWFYMFLMGAVLAVFPELRARILQYPLYLYVVSLIVAIGLSWLAGLPIEGNRFNALTFVTLVLLVFKLAFTKTEVAKKILRGNDFSYGLYLYHMPVINVFLFMGFAASIWSVVAVAGVAIALAVMSWFIVERTALRLKSTKSSS